MVDLSGSRFPQVMILALVASSLSLMVIMFATILFYTQLVNRAGIIDLHLRVALFLNSWQLR